MVLSFAWAKEMSGLSFWVDESEKGDLLAVGGILIATDEVPGTIKKWRDVKTQNGLDPTDEIKWNLPQGHPTRSALEARNRTTRELLQMVIEFIAQQDALTCVVAVMFDTRNLSWWRKWWPGASARDFYCEGMKYLLQRVAEECLERNKAWCVVICDKPELGRESFIYSSIRRGSLAAEEAYRDWYENGVGTGPGGRYQGPLSKLCFHPSLLSAHAKFHDMLQIADVVVGVTRKWVASVKEGRCDSWVIQQIKRLQPRFRQRYGRPGFWGDGLILWPCPDTLWKELKSSLA